MTDAQLRAEAHLRSCAERFEKNYFWPLMEKLFMRMHQSYTDDNPQPKGTRSSEITSQKPR